MSTVASFLPVQNAPVGSQIQGPTPGTEPGWFQVRVSAAALNAVGGFVVSTSPLKLHSIQVVTAGTFQTAARKNSNATTVALLDNAAVHEFMFDSDLPDLTLSAFGGVTAGTELVVLYRN